MSTSQMVLNFVSLKYRLYRRGAELLCLGERQAPIDLPLRNSAENYH